MIDKGSDIVSSKIGKLKIISKAYHNKMWYYKCVCECGKELVRSRNNLLLNKFHACEKCVKQYVGLKNRTHNMTRSTPLYRVWAGMKNRCYNKNEKKYSRYGARGITVCDEWKTDFISFYNWSLANGYKNGLSIDRIDVNGNYCPENCRWVTMKKQENNKTNNTYLTYKGETHSLSEWCEILQFPYSTLRGRLRMGWPVEKALTVPKIK